MTNKINSSMFKNLVVGEFCCDNYVYRCYEVSRNRVMNLYAKVLDGEEILDDVAIYPFLMKTYSIRVEKLSAGVVQEEMEFICGPASSYAKRAWNILSSSNVTMEHIESVLTDAGLPYARGFDNIALSAVRIYLKNNCPDLVKYAQKNGGLQVSMKDIELKADQAGKEEAAAAMY